MKRALPWVLGAVLVLGAGVVTAATPTDQDIVGPLVTHGRTGEPVSSRSIVATVTDATFADEVADTSSGWSAAGNWLVVTLDASAATTEVDAVVQLATLAVDERVFQASERPSDTLRGTPLRVGTDTTGVLAFELPPDVVGGNGELRLASSYSTPELDEVVAVAIDLEGLPRAARVELPPSDWSTR